LFEYNDEDLDTGVSTIDSIQKDFAYRYILTFTQTRALVSASIGNDTIEDITIDNPGAGYPSLPTINVTGLPEQSAEQKFGTSSLHPSTQDIYTLTTKSDAYEAESNRGIVEFFIYLDSLPENGSYYKILETGSSSNDDGLNYKKTFGVNFAGELVFMNHADGSSLVLAHSIPSAPKLVTETWHHIRISYRGSDSGVEVRTMQIYVDGSVVFRLNSNLLGLLNGDYTIGGSSTVNSVLFDLLDGYIDDFVAVDEQPDYTDTITVPTTAQSARVNSVAYENFDFNDITLTPVLTDGALTSISIQDNHDYFNAEPTIVVSAPEVPVFTVGTRASQTLSSGVVISGEVSKWDSKRLTLWLTNVGSDDGKYHEFVTTQNIVDATSGDALLPSTVTEENVISENEQNDEFESFADNIIDFTETNPFGDPDES